MYCTFHVTPCSFLAAFSEIGYPVRGWVVCMNKSVYTVLKLFTQAVSGSLMRLYWVHKSLGFGFTGL